MSKQAVITILKKPNISVWARNYWNGVLRELAKIEKQDEAQAMDDHFMSLQDEEVV